ncbi:MAG: hypothetical protein ACC650_07975 [Gammaproteobacteria bacterium]
MKNTCKFTISLVAIVVLSSCSKFLKQESENLTPFANQTITLVSTLDYGLSDNEYLYLRKIEDYIEVDKPFERYLALENQVGNQLKALVAYSLQMVTIAEQPVSENEKSNQLADILQSLSDLVNKDQVVVKDEIGEERASKIMASVRSSEDYLQSLRLLLPAINEFSQHALVVVDELEKEKRKVVLMIEDAIDKKYGAAIAFEHGIRLVKNAYYNTTIALANYSQTRESKYIQEMRDYGVLPVVDALRGKKSLTSNEMLNIHKIVTQRMAVINENYKYLKPDYDEYFASHQELKKIVGTKGRGIKEARLTFIVWSRAYQKMALGKSDPAEWFDISESGGLLMGAAGRAAGI